MIVRARVSYTNDEDEWCCVLVRPERNEKTDYGKALCIHDAFQTLLIATTVRHRPVYDDFIPVRLPGLLHTKYRRFRHAGQLGYAEERFVREKEWSVHYRQNWGKNDSDCYMSVGYGGNFETLLQDAAYVRRGCAPPDASPEAADPVAGEYYEMEKRDAGDHKAKTIWEIWNWFDKMVENDRRRTSFECLGLQIRHQSFGYGHSIFFPAASELWCLKRNQEIGKICISFLGDIRALKKAAAIIRMYNYQKDIV